MILRLRARLLFTLAALACFASLPVTAQNPASAAPAPTASGRPANSAVTLKFNTAYTGDTPFEARGASAGSVSVAQFGAEIAVPLPPVGGNLFPILNLRYRHYSLDRDTVTPLPAHLKSLSAAFTVFSKLDADWSLLASVSPGVHSAGSNFSSKLFLAVRVSFSQNMFFEVYVGAGIHFT